MTQEKTDIESPFTVDDIEDVRIIIKAKGKHWSIVPKKDTDENEAKAIRIELMRVMFLLHDVVDTPLEEVKEKLQNKNHE